jgi:hypothetical protein
MQKQILSDNALLRELASLLLKYGKGDSSALNTLREHARILGRCRFKEKCEEAISKSLASRKGRPKQLRRAQPEVIAVRAMCTCGGENENCFKCFGTGIYEKKEVVDATPSQHRSLPLPHLVLRRFYRPSLADFASDSRGGSYSIREQGRFDSAPVADDYGDEASA